MSYLNRSLVEFADPSYKKIMIAASYMLASVCPIRDKYSIEL